MKKIDFTISLLILSLLVVVSFGLLTPRVVQANLACPDVEECCGSANCNGPGTVNGCTLTCLGGGTITCDRKGKDGFCH